MKMKRGCLQDNMAYENYGEARLFEATRGAINEELDSEIDKSKKKLLKTKAKRLAVQLAKGINKDAYKQLSKKTKSKPVLKKQQVSVDLNAIRRRTASIQQPYRSIYFKEQWEDDKRSLFF